MTLYTLEPRDPLIARDGRPFGADPGAKASTLPFPMPSTIAGVTRTRAGTDKNTGLFQKSKIAQLLGQAVRGPILVNPITLEFFAPAPNDALMLKDGTVKCLLPKKFPKGVISDLETDLVPVMMQNSEQEKPNDKAPKFWYWSFFEQWLLTPEEIKPKMYEVTPALQNTPAELKTTDPENLLIGLKALSVQTRSHVSIGHETQTAINSALFQTSGLEFIHQSDRISSAIPLALAIETKLEIPNQISPAGGERRLARWQKQHGQLPQVPQGLLEQIKTDSACRIILLTPAHFLQGYRPTWLLKGQTHNGIQAHLKAVACGRPAVVSGWDFVKDKPKPTRRLAPAGSVYYLKLEFLENLNLQNWLDEIWLQGISDENQDRLDGFGIATIGTWNEGKEVTYAS